MKIKDIYMLNKIIVLSLLLPAILLGQKTITGTFSPTDDYELVLLYKVTPTLSEYISSSNVKADGTFQFKLDSTVTKGVYRVVYAVPQEDYNFDVIYNTKENIKLKFNAETGVEFLESKENILLKSYTNSMSMVTQSLGDYFRQETKDTTALNTIFKTQKETQLNFEKAAQGMIALEFIKANKPYIPEKFEDVNTYTNSLKTHYFDHVDFKNITLQSSSFLEERMLNYVFGTKDDTINQIKNYQNNIDDFCNVTKNVPDKVKRILLVDLWEQMRDLNFESVSNYISEEYLLDVAITLNDQELIKDLMLLINTAIGETAPDFPIEMQENKKLITKNLSDLKGNENYILVFWSSTCSHCLNEIPKLQKFIQGLEKELVKVVAVGLEDEPYEWKNLTYSYPEFIHVYGKRKWDNEIGNAYGVKATPTYFVLNRDKKIILKPKDFEALKAFYKN